MKEEPYHPTAAPSGAYGSVETAIEGEYDFDIGTVLSEAWEKTKGIR